MDITGLTYLITIAEERSISKASEKLFMAQSSLSQALQGLEAEMGGKLFIRTSTGVRPTPAGEQMIAYAKKMLVDYHQLKAEIQDIEHLKTGKVEFGVSTFRGSYLIPNILGTFREKYPNIEVGIKEANSMALEQMLIDGQLDLALVALPLTKLKTDVNFLLKDEICIVAPSHHPVLQYAKEAVINHGGNLFVELEDTIQFEYILSDYDTILGSVSRKEFSHRGLVPKVCNENLTAPFAAAMARAGLGLAFTYGSCKEPFEDLTYLSIGEKGVFLDLALAFPPGHYRSKAATALEQHIADLQKSSRLQDPMPDNVP